MAGWNEFSKWLGLDDIIRHGAVGAVALGIAYGLNSDFIKGHAETLGLGGVGLALLVFGIGFYYAYRPLVMTRLLFPLKDYLARKSGNLRRYLRNRYEPMSRLEAELFWYHVRAEHPTPSQTGMRREASGIHFMYMSSLLFLIGFVYSCCAGRPSFFLGVAAIVVWPAALFQDMQLEKLEEFALCSRDMEEIDKLALRLGFELKSGSSPAPETVE